MKALIALEDGTVLPARSFTGAGEAAGEIVFNTSMSGYQEVLTDPSYTGQLVTMTYPLIGNYGVNDEDMESAGVHPRAFLVREYQDRPSNYRATGTLADFLKHYSQLSGIVVHGPGENRVWLNPLARHKAPAEIVSAIRRLGSG